MKSSIRKSLGVLLTLTLLLSVFTGLAVPASAVALEESGQLGDDVYYTIDYDIGEVNITGTGETWRIVDFDLNEHVEYYDSPFTASAYDSHLLKNVTVGEGVTSIGDGLFYQCPALSFSLPETLVSIGEEAFYGAYVSELTLPFSLRSIGAAAFQTSELTSITIPEGVKSIGRNAFQQCLSLRKAAVPGSAAEADDPKKVFEEYRATLLTLAEALRRDGDSEAVTALIDEAVAALTGYVYDDAKTLAENEDTLSDVLALFAGSVKSQRQAERQEALNHEPCSLCGEHHTGSLMENLIGVLHGLIWILRSIILIAA